MGQTKEHSQEWLCHQTRAQSTAKSGCATKKQGKEDSQERLCYRWLYYWEALDQDQSSGRRAKPAETGFCSM